MLGLHLLATPLLGALNWDPTVRGALIVMTAIAILPGSVYLLLATNLGARLGFLVAAAVLTGWLTCQGLVWWIYAQGNRGREPTWQTLEVITGDTNLSTVDAVRGFPGEGWKKLKTGDQILGDAQASADRLLAPGAPTDEHGHPVTDPAIAIGVKHPFKETTAYIQTAGYDKGGETYLNPPLMKTRGLLHKPHYAIIQVKPVVTTTTVPGEPPPKPQANASEPTTTVIMIRDQGSLRLPPFMLFVSSGVLFGILVNVLHRRDKAIMAARAAAATA